MSGNGSGSITGLAFDIEKTVQEYYKALIFYFKYRAHFIQLAKSGLMNLPENLISVRQRLNLYHMQLEEQLDGIANALQLAKSGLLMERMSLCQEMQSVESNNADQVDGNLTEATAQEGSVPVDDIEPMNSDSFDADILTADLSVPAVDPVVLESPTTIDAVRNFNFDLSSITADGSEPSSQTLQSLNFANTPDLSQVATPMTAEDQERLDKELAPNFDELVGFDDLT